MRLALIVLLFCVPVGISDLWDIALQQAANAWGVRIGVSIKIVPEYVDTRGRTINHCKVNPGDVMELAWAVKTNRTIYVNSHCYWIFYTEPEIWRSTVEILTHEMGHVIGLQHSADPKSIMYWLEPDRENRKITTVDRYNAAALGYRSALAVK